MVADGPADDADPLWEPVSLAEMADRHGAPPPVVEDEDEVAEDWTPAPRKPAPRAAAIDDVPADETLDAMRRFFAQADLEEEEEDAPAPAAKPRPLSAWMDDRDATPDAEPTEDGSRATDDSESAFSHKALVRRDFDEDIDDALSEEDFADGNSDDESAAKADARGWADILDDEEPTDEEILAFAIRDPEKLAPAPPPPPPPPSPPVRAKAERPAKRAAASAANGEEDGELDKTIAALRSMIEDAATEPKAAPRRKAKAAPPPPVVDEDDSDDGSAPPFAIADDDAPPPPRKPVGKPSASKGGNAKQSAQEREIEEAMKALRDLVEDEDDVPPESAAPPREAAKAPRPAWDEDDDAPPARTPSRRAMDDEPPSAKPPPPPQPTKDGSPLSKTIATLRGMLELDGRKKR